MKVHHFQALVLGALCLGAAVLAATTYNHQQQLARLLVAAENAPADPVPALWRDLDALSADLAALPAQVNALGEHQRQQDATFAALSKQLDEVNASLKSIEAVPLGPTKADLAALEQRMGNAETAVHALEARPVAPSTQPQPAAPPNRPPKPKPRRRHSPCWVSRPEATFGLSRLNRPARMPCRPSTCCSPVTA